MPKRFLPSLPGLRIAPHSDLLLSPPAHQAVLWPSSSSAASAVPPYPARPVGPVVRLHLRPEPLHLLKAAVQRLVSTHLRSCTAPAEVAKPFPHHWVLTVTYDQNVPLQERALQHEHFSLHATPGKLTHVHVRGASQWGALLGLYSLGMLLGITHTDTEIRAAVHLPSTPLSEGPRVAHRGLRLPPTLDTPALRTCIDRGAQLKFNVLHWVVMVDGRLVMPVAMVRMVVQYAFLRGMQVMFELDDWGSQASSQQDFLRVFMPLSTSPLLHVGNRVPRRPEGMPHQLVLTRRQAGTVHEASLKHWQPGDLVRLKAPQTEAGFQQLATLDLTGVRGATLELPANLMVQLQVAALLWAPDNRAQQHDDPRLAAALAALWSQGGGGSNSDHAMDLEALRFLAESDDAADGGLV